LDGKAAGFLTSFDHLLIYYLAVWKITPNFVCRSKNIVRKNKMPTPIYIIEEQKLRRNLRLIADVAKRADVEIILAFKAFALWKTFPIFREYIHSTTASSLSEARLALEEFGAKAHTFSPAYTDDEIDEIVDCSSHLTFNSLSQYERFHKRVGGKASIGLRVNPEYSEVETLLYNPCAPGTRFGVSCDKLPEQLPEDVEGFHCHCHCESGADVLERTLVHIEGKFAKWFPQLKWLNLGGGHLMTRKDYDVEHLINILGELHQRYPWLKIILEPGSAFAWQTGPLVSHVVDVVEDKGIRTAILDVSFTCHMPDCLEMPYYPEVRGAKTMADVSVPDSQFTYRLGGNSCLSGDFMGFWQFDHELQVGEEVVFEDMIHYTTVKTTMFNGITHPSIGMLHEDGTLEVLRQFGYEDYRSRMD
jgi:carboxynorspermidine decarboxylase